MGNKGKMNDPVVLRYEGNPIPTKDQVPYPVETLHNPGVVKYNDRYIMLFRSHLRNGRSIIGIAESENGVLFKVRKRPFMVLRIQNLIAYMRNMVWKIPGLPIWMEGFLSPIAHTHATVLGLGWQKHMPGWIGPHRTTSLLNLDILFK